MSALFDRQIEQFQHRVQQKINLADDEIQRLSNHLSTIKAHILDAKDQVNRTKTRVLQARQEVNGREQSYQIHTEAAIARLRTEHHALMLELQQKQSQELDSIHHTFDETLASLEQSTLAKISKRTGPIDELLAATQSQFKHLKDGTGKTANELEREAQQDIESLQQLEFTRQERLEAMIQNRNQERLQSLLQAKGKLSDCVTTLEEMERNHSSRMGTFRTRLEAMERSFNEKVKRATETQERTVAGLNRRQEEYEKRAKSIAKTIDRIEKHHRVQIDAAVHEAETLQADVLKSEAQTQAMTEQTTKIQSWREKSEELKKQLEAKVNELGQTRGNNETMKREIARLQHEARLTGGRRAPAKNRL
jgi:chromosome segregation ATPase